jgi:hypothetical protein
MPPPTSEIQELAEKIRNACVQTALTAYENARMDGLCPQGAWESAIGAMQQLDVESLVRQLYIDPK